MDFKFEAEFPTTTDTKPLTAPTGTVTVNEVGEAAVTVPCPVFPPAAENLTTFPPVVLLKPLPVMVTVEPGARPRKGETLEMYSGTGDPAITSTNGYPGRPRSRRFRKIGPLTASGGTVTVKRPPSG